MAEKRMFSLQIVDSDAFLDMPASTQNLYFHLSMRADDDGFVNNPKKIIRMIGASEDDLKVLVLKRFILGFPNGLIVIKHWRINNYLRKDRYHPTQYQEELATLGIKDNGSYTENATGTLVDESVSESVGIPVVHQLDTECREDKSREEKESNNKTIESEFNELWELYPKKQGKKKALDAYKKARKNGTTFKEVKKGILNYYGYVLHRHLDEQYIKQGSTYFNQHGWLDEYYLPEGIVPAEEDHDLDGIL